MKLAEVNRGLELIRADYAEVVKRLQAGKAKGRRKVDYQEVLDEYLATRNFAQTARAFGLSPKGAYLVVYKAIRIAERLSGKSAWMPDRTRGVH